MKQLFPAEIIRQSTESLFVERHTRSKIIYASVLIMFVLLFVAMPFIRVAITTQSRGMIRSVQKNNRLSSAFTGRIEWINLKENQPVSKGDTLIKLNTESIDEEIYWYKKQVNRKNRDMSELIKLLNGKDDFQTPLYKEYHLKHLTNHKKYVYDLNKAEKEFHIYQKLHLHEVIPDREFEEKEYLYKQALNAYHAFKRQAKQQWQNELERFRLQKQEYLSKIKRLKKKKEQFFIISPIEGVITQYSGVREGNFVIPNQLIAEISPDHELMVECYLSPADIGLIRENMHVQFQFDAFNYNQWGLGEGQVNDISGDIVNLNNQLVFKVKCSLNSHELRLKNGYSGRLKKGMTLTARFHITERTLLQLLYDKMDDWLNPKLNEARESS